MRGFIIRTRENGRPDRLSDWLKDKQQSVNKHG